MQRPRRNALLLGIFGLLCLACQIAVAETGILVVHVKDVQRRPVAGLEIGVEGDGGSAITDSKGKARIPLAAQSKENSLISLQVVKSPSGQDLVMVSPWDYRAQVPSFQNESENFVEVVVVRRGDRAALESGTVLKAAVSQINKANTAKSADKQAAQQNPKANLEDAAKQYGLSPEDLDKAIKAWGAKTSDPYDTGLAAFYAGNYDKAMADLQASLSQREQKLAADQKPEAADQKQVADAAFFLGSSLYKQGKYKESAVAYLRSLQIRPEDALVLNETALSLEDAGDYSDAEKLYRMAMAINEKTLPPDSQNAATTMGNLGAVLYHKGDYVGAEPLMRQALAIQEKTLGPDDPAVATALNNLAEVLEAKGDYAGAEPLMRRALAIDQKALGPDDPTVAVRLGNLAALLYTKGDYVGAEPLMRQGLAIDEKALGPDHPTVAKDVNNLAELLRVKRDYPGAEALYRRALAITQKTLGPDHPQVATCLSNLGALLYAKGDYSAAEPLMWQALKIDEKAQGFNHPQVAKDRNNLAVLLQAEGAYEAAEFLYRQALAIREKALGPDHPDVAQSLDNLAGLLYAKGNYADAEPLSRRALAIYQKTLGPNNPTTLQTQKHLDDLVQKAAQTAAPKAKN